MANKWLNYVFNQTDYRESEYSIAVALADAVNENGKTAMKFETLAAKSRVSMRQVQRVVKNFERDGFVVVNRSCVKGRASQFQLNRVTTATPYKDRKKANRVTTGALNRVTTATKKGDNSDINRVTTGAPPYYKEEPINVPSDVPETSSSTAEVEPHERLRFFPFLERQRLPTKTLNELTDLFSHIAEQQNRKTLIREMDWITLCKKLFDEGMSVNGIKSLYRYCKEKCGKEVITPKVMDWKFAEYKSFVQKQGVGV